MNKLRLGPIITEKPVKLTIEIPAALYQDLKIYNELLSSKTNQMSSDPIKLVVPMLETFIKGDKEFKRLRKSGTS